MREASENQKRRERQMRKRRERTFDDSSEYNVFPVQVWACAQSYEELGAVRVGTSVRHN